MSNGDSGANRRLKWPQPKAILPALSLAVVVFPAAAIIIWVAWGYITAWPLPQQGIVIGSTDVPAEPLRIFAVGDVGSDNADQHQVAAQMEAECQRLGGISGIVLLGDNFYQAGVPDVNTSRWDKTIFDVYNGPCLAQAPIYPVLGNHDHKGNTAAQIAKSASSPRWQMPHPFYKVVFGDLLQLVQIDTNNLTWCGSPERCSLDFLGSELSKASEFRWTLVAGHHPVEHGGLKHNDPFDLGRRLQGHVLRSSMCGKVDAYLAGHVHLLQSFIDHCGITNIVSGAGGAQLYDFDPVWHERGFILKQHGFSALSVTSETLEHRFINKNGDQVFRNQIRKSAGGV